MPAIRPEGFLSFSAKICASSEQPSIPYVIYIIHGSQSPELAVEPLTTIEKVIGPRLIHVTAAGPVTQQLESNRYSQMWMTSKEDKSLGVNAPRGPKSKKPMNCEVRDVSFPEFAFAQLVWCSISLCRQSPSAGFELWSFTLLPSALSRDSWGFRSNRSPGVGSLESSFGFRAFCIPMNKMASGSMIYSDFLF